MAKHHQETIEEVIKELGSSSNEGLSGAKAKERIEQYGLNELTEKNRRSAWKILLSQLKSVMVIILIVASVITAFVGELRDTIVILAIVALNTILGFTQEYRAEKAMAALKKMSVPRVKVRRDGKIVEINSTEIVPGDIVILEAGNIVPADMRLIEATNLKIQESALTGESEAVEKTTKPIEEENPSLGDRKNMAYSGTVVTYGRGVGIVTATGMETELGKIAAMLQDTAETQTPLQKNIDQLGKILALIALGIVGVIFVMGLLRGEDLELMFMTAVSFAVAAVPEGLPTVVTIALALGAQRMLKKNALVRKLMAVETLGSVTVICSDKTGTITENRMKVTVVEMAGRTLDFGKENEPDPEALPEDDNKSFEIMLTAAALCNDAEIKPPVHKKQQADVIGDPTEGALVYAAYRVGIEKSDLEQAMPRILEIPFDSERKRMTTIHEIKSNPKGKIPADVPEHLRENAVDQYVAFTKGAVDSLVEVCDRVLEGDEIHELDDDWKRRIIETNNNLAANGMRVLGVAFRPVNSAEVEDKKVEEKNLIFTGIFGMMDPAREGVKESIMTAREAGIRPIMITGDHPLTAGYIAESLTIVDDKSNVKMGREIENLTEEELDRVTAETSVYARVAPEHKLKIVDSLQRQGNVVAMTGDGVNDAPALKQADIGIAMGITGTDVTKEVADMVLIDDNFTTIVSAIREGRTIFDNIHKFIRYILASNFGEIWIMLLGPFFGISLPLAPLQILWLNLVTDGVPALALAVEPPEKDIMKRPPNPTKEHVLANGRWNVILIGLLLSAFSLGVGLVYWMNDINGPWRTMLFSTLVFSQLFFALSVRSRTKSIFNAPFKENPYLMYAVLASFGLQLAVIYVPFMQGLFTTQALGVWDLLLSLALGSAILWIYEIKKLVTRKRQ
ncbi:P-type ATPase, translocating [Mesotoga prima MesG1.Ag.4.2]|uniref:P-type ATPase, translocating n=1 Tax=Mesotoga prima MesG1.Ag.4.2 TaxID=660470 RepID=I2F1W8_9BACT|nr:cation-translocating P-type ATPase [Mesotoga prima]AFK05921.1 P-type ATPase, translocating [Mesotoga prima MesG1.Ag.4.2]